MVTTFEYSQSNGYNKVEFKLDFRKSRSKLAPELYRELVDLAQKIKEQFNEETK